MPAPDSIERLCRTFSEHLDHYKSNHYNETELRREFLDPFWKSLGWDIDNESGYADAYKDVIHEDAIKIGGQTKAPDYCFRIGGTRKFFLEAKKPGVDIRDNTEPAYQLRRYAWSANLPISVLSDFEELAVYDTRLRPGPLDKAATARILYFTFDQYVERWEEIASVFSRDAVLKGSFDRFAETAKRKRGTAKVDDAFLEEIERWRELLARNFALRNAQLNVRGLNFAVQTTIDRLIFLRICEDRGTEQYGRLRSLLAGDAIFAGLTELFRAADDRYNSGLFHFTEEAGRYESPDHLTPTLALDDKVLKDILQHLYYPDSPYEFSVLPADILGQVYERFLGKTIRLTDSHQAKIEYKPEVRKAGGVYYTPSYIVEYIVHATLGRLLNGPDPNKPKPISVAQAEKIKVLDPACGSGSFLIVAYQYLLDWHRNQYSLDSGTLEPEEGKIRRHSGGRNPKLYQAPGGEWRLTTAERKRILLANIHGVDIDSQAVEVTKLSLLLKVLEGETQQQLQRDFVAERQRILPDLGRNILCGNSLIDPDYYGQADLAELDDDSRYGLNVFDWRRSFPGVFAQGGFDCVIGNPPYVLLQADFRDDEQLGYFRNRYKAASYKLDTYHLFIERAIGLLAPNGWCSLITPSNYLSNNYLEPLRRLMLESSRLESITIFDYPVFPGVSVDTAIFLASSTKPRSSDTIRMPRVSAPDRIAEPRLQELSRKSVLDRPGVLLLGESAAEHSELTKTIAERGVPLKQIATVNFGKQLRNRKIYLKDVIALSEREQIPRTHIACITGSDIERYSVTWGGLACLRSEEARCGGCWDEAVHNARGKLVCRQIGKHPFFGVDEDGLHCLNTIFMIVLRHQRLSEHYVLGILNSRVLAYYWEDQFYDQRKTFPKIKGTYLKEMPIRLIDFDNREDVDNHDRLAGLVQEMVSTQAKMRATKNPSELKRYENAVQGIDEAIETAVCALYGLNVEQSEFVARKVQLPA